MSAYLETPPRQDPYRNEAWAVSSTPESPPTPTASLPEKVDLVSINALGSLAQLNIELTEAYQNLRKAADRYFQALETQDDLQLRSAITLQAQALEKCNQLFQLADTSGD